MVWLVYSDWAGFMAPNKYQIFPAVIVVIAAMVPDKSTLYLMGAVSAIQNVVETQK